MPGLIVFESGVPEYDTARRIPEGPAQNQTSGGQEFKMSPGSQWRRAIPGPHVTSDSHSDD
jgi:hypothetical protein